MSSLDPEKRKDIRRDHIKKKHLDKQYDHTESRDRIRIKKQFKKQRENLIQDELWEEWNDEIH